MRAGSKIYKGLEVPITAPMHINKQGREFYISGICYNTAFCRYIDTGEIIEVKSNLVSKYLVGL
jgi:hypothetical protein